jgi:transcriptional regulator with XRE-family HTH domain
MVRWNIETHMRKKGWTTAYQLAKETGISQPAAHRVLSGDELDRIDVGTLEALARAFGLRRDPWRLFDFSIGARPDE